MIKYLLILVLTLCSSACVVDEHISDNKSVDPDPVLPTDSVTTNVINQSVFNLLDLNYPGLQDVKKYYEAGDIFNAAVELLKYYRKRPVYNPNVNMLATTATANEISIANQATKEGGYRFKVYDYTDPTTNGLYYSFIANNDSINWEYLPKEMSGENEFRYQLHRHQWMIPQAKAYKATGDDKYIKAWIEVYFDWLKTYPCPEGTTTQIQWTGLQTSSRTHDQMDLLFYYIHSELFTSELLSEFLVAFHSHVQCIIANWYKVETSNIRFAQEQVVTLASILMPEFKKSTEWFSIGKSAVTSQLTGQFNSDGVHNEFDPSYHLGVVADFYEIYKVAQANNRLSEFPADYIEYLRNASKFIMNISYPDYSIDNFNDTRSARMTKSVLTRNLKQYSEMFPDDMELKWFAYEGTSGTIPQSTLITYPISGYYIMRNGWLPTSTMLVHKNCYDQMKRGHNHPDNGHISLYINGRKFLPDAGVMSYSGSDYTTYRSTEMHNVVTKNRSTYANREGKLLKSESTTEYDVVVTENKGYEDLSQRRAVYFVEGKFFVVVDEAYGICSNSYINLNFKLWGGKDKDSEGYPKSGKKYTVIDVNGAHSIFDDGNNIIIKSFSETSDDYNFESGTSYYSNEIGQKTQRYWYRMSVTKKADKAVRFVTVIYPYGKVEDFEKQSITAKFIDNSKDSAGVFHQDGASVKVTINGVDYILSYKL